MQALVLEEYRNLQLRNVAEPEVGSLEVLVKVNACVASVEVMCMATMAALVAGSPPDYGTRGGGHHCKGWI
jgi:NADPH:quinone reductase-like Zn-dependent oxidoreductase